MHGTSVILIESILNEHNRIWRIFKKIFDILLISCHVDYLKQRIHFKPLTRDAGMESHPKSAFVHRQPSLPALLCLFVLLPYLLLPVVFYGHLSGAFFLASQADTRAGLPAIGTHPEKSPQPYHPGNTCPVCRAASSFDDYGYFSWSQVPDCASPVRLTAFINAPPSRSDGYLWVSGPRAPPVSL
jgi:hypothetical protein